MTKNNRDAAAKGDDHRDLAPSSLDKDLTGKINVCIYKLGAEWTFHTDSAS